MALAMLLSVVAACGKDGDQATTPDGSGTTGDSGNQGTSDSDTGDDGGLPWLEYTIFVMDRNWGTWIDNPNDVVTPYVEDRFHIRATEIYPEDDQSLTMWLNLWIASDTLPDVINTSMFHTVDIAERGIAADLTDLLPKMENYMKYYPKQMEHMLVHTDGRLYQMVIPTPNLNVAPYSEDPWIEGSERHCLWLREDILAMLGYEFTPMDEIKKNTLDQGRKPTMEDFAINPPIATPDDWYEYLKKVADLNLMVNDLPVIPMTMVGWQHFHYGTMFDFGTYSLSATTGEVKWYLDSPGAKPYFQWLNKLYREGLLDGDSFIQMDEQLQEKVASGRAASGFNSLDMVGARQMMGEVVDGARIRYIPWPRGSEDKGYYNVDNGGFLRYVVNADSFTGDELVRLTQYWDWFYSDEGFDILSWGPESAGLWEMQDGVKKFVDPDVEYAMLNGIRNEKGADYWGLFDKFGHSYNKYWSRAGATAPAMNDYNPFSSDRSYPPDLDIDFIARNMQGDSGFSTQGWAADNDGTEVTTEIVNFYWAAMIDDDVPRMVVAKTDAEFDAAWEAAWNRIMAEGYGEAKAAMEVWFAANPPFGPPA